MPRLETPISGYRAPEGQMVHLGELGASAWVVASDAPTLIKQYAEVLKADGHLVWVCDGTADEVEINAAITAAAGGGTVRLAKGTYYTAGEILVNQEGTILKGGGWKWVGGYPAGTVIIPQETMTNSILVSQDLCRIEDLFVHGNSKAAQIKDTKAYSVFSHIGSYGHTTYGLWTTGNWFRITNRCLFVGKPVRIRGEGSIEGSYFNGSGFEPCVQIVSGNGISIADCCMESYLASAVVFLGGTNIYAVSIIGNYFESAFVVANVLNFAGNTLCGGRFEGNYEGPGVNTTNFLTVGSSTHPVNDIVVKGNWTRHPIVVGDGVESIEAVVGRGGSTITFNTLTGLTYLKVIQPGIKELYGTAAPTTGTWAVGDKVWNKTPAAGGAPGWVCTTAGTPGTWKAMASVAS